MADHTHEHVFLGPDHAANERRTMLVVAITAAMMIAEIAAGRIFGSMALLADGFHMATHAGAMGIAAAAYWYSRRHVHDPRFSWGTGKIGDLAGFASAMVLGLVAIAIAVESAGRLIAPSPIIFGDATLVATLGLAVNLVSAWLLAGGGHHHHHHGHDHDDRHAHDQGHGHGHDNNMRSAYIHVLADALTSLLAILALLAGRYLGWGWADPLTGLVGALVIAQWSITLMRDSSRVLLDSSEEALAERVRERVEGDGDARVADLHVWRVGPGMHAAIVALVADRPREALDYRARLSGIEGLTHISIEVGRCPVAPCAVPQVAAT